MLRRLPGIDIPASPCPQPGNLSCSPHWSRLLCRKLSALRSTSWRVQVPLVGAVGQLRCHMVSSFHLMRSRVMLGTFTYFCDRHQARMHQRQRPMTWFLRRCTGSSSVVQRVTLESWAWASSSSCGETGSCALQIAASQPASRTRDFFPCRRQSSPALCGWLESQSGGTMQMGTSCISCGDASRQAYLFDRRQPCDHCGGRREMLVDQEQYEGGGASTPAAAFLLSVP